MKKLVTLALIIIAFLAGSRYNQYTSKREALLHQKVELETAKLHLAEAATRAALTGYEAKFQELESKVGHDFLVFIVKVNSTPDVLRSRLDKPIHAREHLVDINKSLLDAAFRLSEIAVNTSGYDGSDRPAMRQAAQRPLTRETEDKVLKLYQEITLNLFTRLKSIEKMNYVSVQ